MKPFAVVKKSEWEKMPKKTKKALTEMCEHLSKSICGAKRPTRKK